MDPKVEITKQGSIDTLVSGYVPGKVEEAKVPVSEGEMDFSQLLRSLKGHLRSPYRWDAAFAGHYMQDVKAILTARQIDAFLGASEILETETHYKYNIGFFVNKLIRNSYDSGVKEFHLHPSWEIPNLLSNLNPSQRIRIIVSGDVGECCVTKSCNLDVIFENDVREKCGQHASDCSFFIQGKVGSRPGYKSQRCIFRTDTLSNIPELSRYALPDNRIVFVHHDGYEEELK